jgi:broad specificity phosphatase PhoE
MLTRIYLVRHGQTAWNAEGRWQGTLDIPLGELGHLQARALADHLKERPITAIYSSDLSRAHATAEPLARVKGIEIQTDERLRELHFGIFQGLTHEEIRRKYPAEERQLFTNYMDYIVPEGESRREMQNRAYEIWNEVIQCHPNGDVLLMSHGGPVRLLLMKLFSEQRDRMLKVPLPNVSLTTIVADGDSLRLEGLAEVGHLEHIVHPDSR